MIIPEGFFNEETRCGFTVTARRKRIWACELNMLSMLLRVCRSHSLKVFTSGGTTLGAVRHNGFVPWDDDIDMVMPRPDYDRLMEIGPKEFTEPYFFQCVYTEPYYNHQSVQIRDSRTTAIPWSDIPGGRKSRCHQGIFIDVFCNDAVPVRLRDIRKKVNALRLSHDMLKTTEALCRMLPAPLYRATRWDSRAFRRFEAVERRGWRDDAPYLSSMGMMNERMLQGRDFREAVDMRFEYLTVPVPVGYDNILTTMYGDWRKPSREGALHGALFLDPDNGYRDYICGVRDFPRLSDESI